MACDEEFSAEELELDCRLAAVVLEMSSVELELSLLTLLALSEDRPSKISESPLPPQDVKNITISKYGIDSRDFMAFSRYLLYTPSDYVIH